MSDIIIFNIPEFRLEFPQFVNTVTFPDTLLQRYFNAAIDYISDVNYGWMGLGSRTLALSLMTAHLADIVIIVNKSGGSVPGLVQSSTIDKVSVSLTPPPLQNQWQWWLSLTPYGQQLLALLQAGSVGGFYIGGRPERSAFRKVGGTF